jgi:hypothetical protein
VNQQTNFWTKPVKDTDSLLNKSAQPSMPLATYMTQCEASEWKRRHKDKVQQLGKVKAQSWWFQVKDDILRIRGQDGHDTLIAEMKRQQHETRSKD